MFVAKLRKSLSHIIQAKSIPTQIGLNGFAMIQLCELGEEVSEKVHENTWNFIAAVDELAGEFNAQFVGIAFNCILLRRINNAAVDSRDVNPVRDQDCQATASYDNETLAPLPGTPAYNEMMRLKEISGINCLVVDCMHLSQDDINALRQAMKKHTGELVLYKTHDFSVRRADDCNQTGESSCGSMLGSAGNGFAKPDDAECVFQLQRGQNGDWSVAGQTTGMAWLGKDPLYALAAFLGRDDVCRFMEDAGRKEKGRHFCLKYRTPDSLPEPGGRIKQFRKLHDSLNEYEPLLPPVPQCRELVYKGNTWHSEDVFIVHDNYLGVPRYFTRIYPEVREGDLVFVQLDNGSYQTAFVHEGQFRLHDDCGLVHDNPIVLGVEIDIGYNETQEEKP
ncbi:hypothetical protein [Morganella phage Mecenats66]|nr:hypothetical protein [Morganella phage Mecenats66]